MPTTLAHPALPARSVRRLVPILVAGVLAGLAAPAGGVRGEERAAAVEEEEHWENVLGGSSGGSGQPVPEDAAEGPRPADGSTGVSSGVARRRPSLWEEFRDDPSFGGRLHFTYRLDYRALFFRTGHYRFPFPDDVTVVDRQFARELEDAHRGNQDQDLDQYLSIRTEDLFTPWRSTGLYQGLSTEFSVRYFKDIDGTPPGSLAASTFNGLSNEDDLQLYTLNATVKLLEERLELTGGRMYVESAEWVHIDGGKARLRGLGLFDRPVEIVAFAGERVSFYRSPSGRAVYGGSVRYLPTRDTSIELADVYYFENTFRAEVVHHLLPGWSVALVYRQINEDPESLRADTVFERDDWGFDLRAGYYGKFGRDVDDFIFGYALPTDTSAAVVEYARRFNVADLEPFDELTLELRQEVVDSVGVFVGATGHWLRGGSEPDVYNTDWYETWGGIDTLHVPWEGLTGRLTARYLDTELPRRQPRDPSDPLFLPDVVGDGEPEFLGFEVLLEQDFARRVALGATFNWRIYTYDSRFARLEDLDAVAVSAYLRYRPNSLLTFYFDYTYEDDYRYIQNDFRDVQAVRASILLSW